VAAPEIVSTGGNWDGAYIGAFAGYGWGTLSDDDGLITGLPDAELDVNGWQIGVAAGADFTLSEALVAGIVADIAWNNASGEDTTVPFDYNMNWSGSVRGRLGFDGGAFLPYVTAGLAFANATAEDATGSDDATHIGWTVGAGVEFAVADNVSLDLQYRYSDYGSQDYDLPVSGTTPLSLTSHAVTAGVNFRF
jgi:outer membrane immunogenic protein